jgi:hypothetical protein
VTKLRNQDSRSLKLSMKVMRGEAALLQSRQDGGGAFPVEAEKRKSRVDAVDARSGVVMRRYLSTLWSMRGMRGEQWGDTHPREVARLVACQ